MKNIISAKTTTGVNILSEFCGISSDGKTVLLKNPIELRQVPIIDSMGLHINIVPVLYSQFTETNTILHFDRSLFVMFSDTTLFNERYYHKMISELFYMEMKRILLTDIEFNHNDYPLDHIHTAPEILM